MFFSFIAYHLDIPHNGMIAYMTIKNRNKVHHCIRNQANNLHERYVDEFLSKNYKIIILLLLLRTT